MTNLELAFNEKLQFDRTPALVLLPQPETVATGLSVVRGLGRHGVPVVAVSDGNPSPSLKSRYISRTVKCPSDAVGVEAWVKWLADVGAHCDPSPILFVCSDVHVYIASQFQEVLAEHFRYHVLADHVLTASLDKHQMHRAAVEAGISSPSTMFFGPGSVVQATADDVVLPAVVKPSIWVETTDRRLGRAKFSEVLGSKAVRVGSTSALVSVLDTVAGAGLSVVIQQEIPGPQSQLHSVGLYVDQQGEVAAAMVGHRLRQLPMDCGTGTLWRPSSEDRLIAPTERLVKHMGYRGIAEVEWKIDPRDGQPYFLEINPRPWASLGLWEAAGMNLVLRMYCDLAEQSEFPVEKCDVADVVWVDFWRDLEVFWKSRTASEASEERLGLLRYISTLRGRQTGAFWASDDRGPGLFRARSKIRELSGRLLRKVRRSLHPHPKRDHLRTHPAQGDMQCHDAEQ